VSETFHGYTKSQLTGKLEADCPEMFKAIIKYRYGCDVPETDYLQIERAFSVCNFGSRVVEIPVLGMSCGRLDVYIEFDDKALITIGDKFIDNSKVINH
jgi:hypothetical protein